MKTKLCAIGVFFLVFIFICLMGFSQGTRYGGKGGGYHAHCYSGKGSYMHPAYMRPAYVHPAYVHPAYLHPAYVHPAYAHPAYIHPYVYPYVVHPHACAPIYYGVPYVPFVPYFQFMFPPIGITISTLPFGYMSFHMGPNPYYYYNGTFYRPFGNEYEVIAPPLGAMVEKLPQGSKVRVINGEKYYEMNGTYYQEQLDDKDRLSYRVVGTDGVLNTDVSRENTLSGPQSDRTVQFPADKTRQL